MQKLPHASTLCGACRDACPVKIDLPRLLLDLRADQVDDGDAPWVDSRAMQAFVQTMKSPRSYATAGAFARTGSDLLTGLSGGNVKFLPPPFSAWTSSRDFPPFARRSFHDLWKERQKQRKMVKSDE